ncbi:addiction module antidote protein [Rhizorhabdus sp. FW153]|uniref:addiction module antidote protein n=1 Tax=Rhizorhabdus sp. FW153 TaxID=3400216 RepID=UPI003CF5B2E9
MRSRPPYPPEQPDSLASSLEPVFERGDPAEIRRALKHVARAHGVSVLARETGLTREAIYKALGDQGNPTLDTLSRLLDALELRLSVRAAHVEGALAHSRAAVDSAIEHCPPARSRPDRRSMSKSPSKADSATQPAVIIATAECRLHLSGRSRSSGTTIGTSR